MIRWWWSAIDLQEPITRMEEKIDILAERCLGLERSVQQMPTRQDLDQAKQTLKEEIDAVVQGINDLKTQLQNGQPITQQDLDDLSADLAELQGTGFQPQPQPSPGPAPGPTGRQ